ncbi:TfoX/Sxy family protein [Candidatus Cloacimonadota bacterium]
MPYDEGLFIRITELLDGEIEFEAKKMFGGICYLLNGNMLGGIINDELIIRAGKENHEELLKLDHTRVFDITGKVMKGWILVEPEGIDSSVKLRSWLEKGITFAQSLPPK